MAQQKPSNYDITRERMEKAFAQYDQQAMIQKFGLEQDRRYLYVCMLGRRYRIDRSSGRVEGFAAGKPYHANFNESMILFDMLAWSRPGCTLTGQFMSMDSLKGTLKGGSPSAGPFAKMGEAFTGKTQLLARSCAALGGKAGTVGDVSSTLPLFDFFPVVLQFWDADEDFPAVLKFMWDGNALEFMHYETLCYAVGHTVSRLQETMKELGGD